MRDTRIILVEGMPGTGKSTVSQFINLQLCANGQPSYWCHEERAAHPVRLFYERERHRSWSDYSEEAASRWQSYAQEMQARNQIAVLDASILQNHVRSMLLFGCGWKTILDLVRRIENLLASLRPCWIYLKPKDIERNFRDVVDVRGQRLLDLWIQNQEQFPYARNAHVTGFPGFIAFWEEFGEISDRVFDELAIPKLRQHVSPDDWNARFGEILNFLDLPLHSNTSSYSDLDRFTGNYMPTDDHTESGFILLARNGCLIMSCNQPTMDAHRGPIGCYREIRLIPKEKNRFYVEAWPHEVEFAEDTRRSIVSMQLSTSEEGWARSSGVYVRQSRPS